MTVHMIRLLLSPDADAALVQPTTGFIAVWLTNFQPWEELGHSNDMPSRSGGEISGQPEHLRADWRFEWTEDRSILLDNLWGHVEPRTPWARMGYHECDHDESDRDGCSWDLQRETGSVPAALPAFTE